MTNSKNKLKEKNKEKNSKINKKKLIIISIVISMILITVSILLGLTVFNKDWKEANNKYKIALKIAEKKNDELDALILISEKLVNSKEKALDETLRSTLKKAISEAKTVKKDIPFRSLFIKKINKKTKELNKIDYEKEYSNLESKYNTLNKSMKQYKLVDNPTEEYILSRLKEVNYIYNITAYTEETDVDKHLGKSKWYYSKIVFQHKDVHHYGLDNKLNTITEIGNPAGGCIELYRTVEDAERRNQEMANLEGTVRSPGSHKVIGTILIRTSDDLSLTKQKELEKEIIEVLTYIEESYETEESITTTTTTTTTTKKKTTTKKPKSEKVVFKGGTAADLDWKGKGKINKKTTFSETDQIYFTGKISGFTGKKNITYIQKFPNGDYFVDEFDVQSGDVLGYGYVDCGIGEGSFTVKLTKTGEVLGHYEFTIK